MYISTLTESRRAEWNALIKREGCFSMLQSWEWGTFKQGLGWEAFRVAVEDGGGVVAGAQLLIKPLALGLSVAYVPRGPVGAWLNVRTAQPLLDELCRLARAHRAIFLKIEPPVHDETDTRALLESCGFHHTQATNQPQATILLDLTQGQAGVLQQMRKKTRQYVHRAEREGITVRFGDSKDLPAYFELMRLTGRREHFAPRSLSYYQSEWKTLSVENRGALVRMPLRVRQLVLVDGDDDRDAIVDQHHAVAIVDATTRCLFEDLARVRRCRLGAELLRRHDLQVPESCEQRGEQRDHERGDRRCDGALHAEAGGAASGENVSPSE